MAERLNRNHKVAENDFRNCFFEKKAIRGQASIWVIVAIVLVASVILFFIIDRSAKLSRVGEGEAVFDVQSYLESCSTELVNEIVEKMLPQGGFVLPKNFATFNDLKIEYTCKNNGYYEPCIQQHPMLIREMENEIKNYTTDKIEECFDDMEKEFRKRGSDVALDPNMEYNVDLEEDKILLNIKRKVKIEKGGDIRRGEEYKVEIPSPAYNLGRIAAEIADQEARFCYFEFVGYSILYPRYEVDKYSMSDATNIYTIRDFKSLKEMNIAIRGCAIPAGL